MTNRLGKGDAVRGRARLALLSVVSLSALLVLTAASGSNTAQADVSGTPTATTTQTNEPAATTTPAPPGGATIELLNPSGYVDPVIVSENTDTDPNYHLVAWVGNVGGVESPVVEFRISGETTTTIAGTRAGGTHVWHALWDVTQPAGDYTVTARLMNGANTEPIATDLQSVVVDNAREAVEITYPTVAGTLGTFDPIGPAQRGFVIDATVSGGATGVDVFYGTSPTGTEQNWRRCEVQETVEFSEARTRRIGCTVGSDVTNVFQITGVAAVATGAEDLEIPPQCTDPVSIPPTCATVDSGDAHRVFAYDQFASSLSLAPNNASPAPGTCHVISATALDLQGRPIWRANVDVHATGPIDGLQFGAVEGRTRDWQPADSGDHTGTEATNNCGGEGTPPEQAEHGVEGPDQKHIETKPADQAEGGTDTSGAFTFALISEGPGTTSVQGFGDGDDDDTRGTEPLGTATIGWGAPTPGSSASASRSPSASATPSSSPTGSSTTPTPTPAARTVTLETSRNTVVFGKTVVFSGVVDSTDADCEGSQLVNIQQQTVGAAGFSEIGTTFSDPSGAYVFRHKPSESASYRAQLDPSAECQAATSDTRAVLVRARVGLNVSDSRVPKGSTVRLKVSVKPCGDHADTAVVLERNQGKGFDEIGRKKVNEQCKATFKKRVKKDARFRARWPSQDDNHESGVSRTRRVETVTLRRRNF